MRFEKELALLLEIKKEAIWIKSEQEKEVVASIVNTLKEEGMDVIYDFEPSSGIYKLTTDNKNNIVKTFLNPKESGVKNGTSGAAILSLYNKIQNDGESMELSAIILKDMDLLYNNYAWSRVFREILEFKQNRYTPIIVISPTHQTNATLDHLFKELNYDDLTDEDIVELINDYAEVRGQEINASEVSKYFAGYSRREIIETLDESYARYDELNYNMLKQRKIDLMKSSGLLSYKEPKVTMKDMGGNHKFKEWFEETKLCMTPEAREIGLDLPKGYLALGIPGCSKTLGAECVAAELDVPFLKLDMSKILTKFVGESERKIDQAITLIKSCAPCVLLIDEVEKCLGGYQSSNASDSGTLARVFGSILEMLNDNTNGIFCIMTSNNVKELPPELTRAGRLDAIFYFSAPTLEERKEIFKVHMNKKDLTVSDDVLKDIAVETQGYTGAEIEQIVKNSMKKAFLRCTKEGKKFEVEKVDLIAAKNDVIPITISSQEKIRDLEEWVKGRAIYASEEPKDKVNKKISTKSVQSASKLLAKNN